MASNTKKTRKRSIRGTSVKVKRKATRTKKPSAAGYTEVVKLLPTKPNQGAILPDVSHAFSAIVQVAKDVLINPDIAFRTDRTLSEQMIRDPMIMTPLQKRMLATAQLEWQILPDDDTDDAQVQVAQELDKIIRNIPKLVELFKDLLWATFRGTGVTELDWYQSNRTNQWNIVGHRPHNGDKIVYDIRGNPRMLTRLKQTGGRELLKEERDRLIIHVFDPEDGSFFEGAEAGYLFKGRGLRDVVWQYWWLKHNALKFWLRFLERYGGGMVFGRYPMTNAKAKTAIESVLVNLMNDSMVSIPVPTGVGDKDTYGIEIAKSSGTKESSDTFMSFVEDWAGKHIRHCIEGQDLTGNAGSSGMGSDLARVHQDTFRMYRDYDAMILADTITQQLVEPIKKFNYGQLPFRCKFAFVLDQEEWEQQEKRVDAAARSRLAVPKKWIYETLSIPIPTEDDEIIQLGEQVMPGGGGFPGLPGGGLNSPSRDLFGPPASEVDFESARLFREALQERF